MDQDFVEALIHRRIPLVVRWRGYSGHVVLGSRLRPFSLWHQQLLAGIDSPFFGASKAPASIEIFKDLYIATQYCRVKPGQLPTAKGWRAKLRRKWIVFWFYFRVGLRKPGFRFIALCKEAAKFRAYMKDYGSCPIPFPNKHSRPAQTPVALFQVERYLKYHPRVGPKEVWAMAPGVVAWENIAGEEVHGTQIEILTEARKQAREAALRGGRKKSNGNGQSNA